MTYYIIYYIIKEKRSITTRTQWHSLLNNITTIWQKLIKHIEWAAYNGYNFYELNPREWQYMDRLVEYGFEVVRMENCKYIIRWDHV